MNYSILTLNGWKDTKSLSEKTKLYTLKDKSIVIDRPDFISFDEDYWYSYNLENVKKYACPRTKVFSFKGELSFNELFSNYGSDFKVPVVEQFSVNIEGIEKTEEEIDGAVENKMTTGWVKKLDFQHTRKFIQKWIEKYEKLYVEGDKDTENMQIIMLKIGKLTSVKTDGNGARYVDIISQSGVTDGCDLLGKLKIKLPMKNGEFMHFFVKDETNTVTLI